MNLEIAGSILFELGTKNKDIFAPEVIEAIQAGYDAIKTIDELHKQMKLKGASTYGQTIK